MNKPRLRLHVRNHTGMTVSIQEASRSREFKPIPDTRGPVISQPPHPGTSIVTPRQHVARDQIAGRHLHVNPRTITQPRGMITLQPRGQPFHPQRNRRTPPPQLTVRLTVETRKLINHQDTVSFAIDPIDCTFRPRAWAARSFSKSGSPLQNLAAIDKHIRLATTIARRGRIPPAHMLIGGTAISRDGTILDKTSRNIRPRKRGSDGTRIVTTPRIPRPDSRRRSATQRPGLIHGLQMADDTNGDDKHDNKKNITNLTEHDLLLSGKPHTLWSA